MPTIARRPMRSRLLMLAVVAFMVTLLSPVAFGPSSASAEGETIKINEVESSDGSNPDWIEIINIGSSSVDISGYVLKDNSDTSPFTVAAGTNLAAGGLLVVEPAFGLGSSDSARLFLPGPGVLLDSYTWTAHAATTYGRCPDGTGPFTTTNVGTKGAVNDCPLVSSPIKINEIESNGDTTDWVELINTSGASVDISGWGIKDNDNTHTVIPFASGTSIAAGGLLVIEEPSALGFGLGQPDSVRLLNASGALVDSYSWTTHATTTYGRCPDGTGAFTTTTAPTKNAANNCSPPPPPIKINEVESNGDTTDWIELINTGSSPVDISGFVLKDSTDSDPFTVSAATTLAAGAFYVVEPVFGLGGADSARVFLPDGTTLLDSYSWTAHATTTYGRCPDGTGAFTTTAASTKGAANNCAAPIPPIKINEVESNGDTTDWIELINTGSSPVDISGFVLKDSTDSDPFTVPAATTLAAGGYYVVEPVFGLGGADSARVFLPGPGALVDSYSWTAHATTTYGRCPDGTGAFTTTVASTKGAANNCPVVAAPVKINEIESSGGTPGDWVELINTTAAPVDVTGWSIKDNDDAHTAVPFPSGSIIPGNGFLVIEESLLGFGLGSPDSVRLYNASSVLVETYSWTPHAATTYGRCPDATGDFTTTTSSTKGAPNDCSAPVKINEVESDGGSGAPDWIELVNNSAAVLDVSNYVLKDNDDTHVYTIPSGTTIAANGYLVVEEPVLPFGLGSGDSARLFAPGGVTLLDSYSWTAHATTTYGRCPTGTGDFTTTSSPTKGAANACPGDIAADPWPGSPNVTIVDAAGAFPSNLSGLTIEASGTSAPGVMWAARNGPGALFRLLWNGTIWTPDTANGWAAGKLLHYADGTGDADAEGVTFAATPAGGLYAATERNNSANSISRNSILRYDPSVSATDLNALNEWNITADIPATTPNTGLEAVTWVPDSFLVAHGFLDESTNAPYNPANYAAHAGGVFFVGVEQTGAVYGYVLNHVTGNTFTKVATITSGFIGVMGLEFDRDQGKLWVVCDNGCNGRSAVFEIAPSGKFTASAYYERPAAMDNLNNEGFAISADQECNAGLKPVFWSDDSGTDGHAIRAGSIPCTFVDTDADDDGFSDADEAASAGTPPGNLLGSDPHNAASTPEVCDGADNDLNEGVDEGFADSDNDGIKDCVDPQDDTDTDHDGVRDALDNCDRSVNSNQADSDHDGKGDACDADGLVPAACSALVIDNVIKGTSKNETLNGTAFNDLILAMAGNDTVNGNGGDDCVDGGDGNDTITTLGGNDVIVDSGGNNTINAGNGANVLRIGNGNDKVTTGTGADDLELGDGNNQVQSGGGGDKVTTGGDNDTICTGAFASFGNIDTCSGGSERDVVNAGSGNNKVNAGNGGTIESPQTVSTEGGNDEIVTGTGVDVINAGNGNNTIQSGGGGDSITTGGNNDVICTGAFTSFGNIETCTGAAERDAVDAGSGNNKVRAGDGGTTALPQTVTTGDGNDEIVTGNGVDVIIAGNGNNKVQSGSGGGSITTLGGNDVICAGTFGSFGDFDTCTGGDGTDVINAGSGNNKVNAGSGGTAESPQTVTTEGGNDDILTGNGVDIVNAGNGNNTVQSGGGGDSITTGGNNDVICTGTFASFGNIATCIGGAERDVVDAGSGNNKVGAGDGGTQATPQQVTTGDGNDDVTTGSGVDVITAGNGNNTVDAGDGANTVTSGGGNDDITAGSGADSITTNGGNDSIDCGGGSDVANSGSGNDTNVGNRCETFS